MEALLKFYGGVRRDPEVDRWISLQPEELGAIARYWFDVMRKCGPDVRELMHDGCPTACIDDAAFCYVNAFTAHVNVGFFCGMDLEDPGKLLLGTGKRMRHVRLRPGVGVDERALHDLIKAAYIDIKARWG